MNSPRTEIVYLRSAWNGRLRGAKPELARALRPKLDTMLAAAEGRFTASDRVRMALPELLNEGEPNGQHVAQRLSMSWRTLQRRLEAGGTTFRTLLDETRFRLAREWLNHTAMPIKVVAARLGYADQRAFDRAFHRWANMGRRSIADMQPVGIGAAAMNRFVEIAGDDAGGTLLAPTTSTE